MPDICDDGHLTSWGSRDVNCALDVNRMAKLGKFPVAFDVYGCAYMEEGELCYRVGSQEEKMFEYMMSSVYENRYPTPLAHLTFNTVVPSDMYERIMEETKYRLARKMQRQYKGLFYYLQPLAETLPNDNGLPFLQQMMEVIEGHFDDGELQMLEGAVQFAFKAKVLTASSHQHLMEWVAKVRRQMADDPVVQDSLGRTFYGFGYEMAGGQLGYYFDAQKVTVYDKYQFMQLQGKFVTPIYYREYWFSHFNQLADIKKQFRSELANKQDQQYLKFLKCIKGQAGVIERTKFDQALLEIKKNCSKEAILALKYYGYQWNWC